MFFSLGPVYDHRFPVHTSIGQWRLSHDPGWQGLRKGYGTVDQDNSNFCYFSPTPHGVKLHNSACRTFPLWWDNQTQTLTNMLGQGQQIYVDQTVEILNNELLLTPVDLYSNDASYISADAAVEIISQHLTDTVLQQANSFKTPVRFLCTGGADTSLLLALIHHCNLDVEVLDHQYFEYDLFCQQNWQSIATNHWGYAQIHHWCEPCVLLSGASGDEFMMRGPDSVSLWAAWHNIDINALVDSTDCYQGPYFKRTKNQKIFAEAYAQRRQIQEQYTTIEDLNRQIINMIANDFQHWHLGKTLTWTPLRSLQIAKTLLRLPPDILLGQILNADINRELIKQLHAPSLAQLSQYKNIGDGSDLIGRMVSKDGNVLLSL